MISLLKRRVDPNEVSLECLKVRQEQIARLEKELRDVTFDRREMYRLSAEVNSVRCDLGRANAELERAKAEIRALRVSLAGAHLRDPKTGRLWKRGRLA